MNRKYLDALEDIANQLGLTLHKEMGMIYGDFNSYKVFLVPVIESQSFTLKLSLHQNNSLPQPERVKEVVRESKIIKSCKVQGRQVFYILKAGKITKHTTGENLKEALAIITDHLKMENYQNCCEECGTEEDLDFYNLGGSPTICCGNCFKQSSDVIAANEQVHEQKQENFVAGLVGGLIGSLLGVAAIVILGQLGYVSALSGIIMAVCSIKGYELLGGKLTNRGILGTSIIMVIMVYFGTRLNWAISLASYFEQLDIFTAFRVLPEWINQGFVDGGMYYWDLILVYVFTALGAIPTILNMRKNKEAKGESYRMSS